MDKSLMDQLSIGLELEANVIHAETGKAVINFNNSEAFAELELFLKQAAKSSLQSEFDAATIELATAPASSIDQAFQSLLKTLKLVALHLSRNNTRLLLLGLHPGRGADQLQITDKERCYQSLPLMNDNGRSLFYCSFQINFGIPYQWKALLFPLCHALQAQMWPCSVVTQSSSIYASQASDYHCYREHLNEALADARTGPLPAEIQSWEEFEAYCARLPNEALSPRKNNVWFDIFPKLLNEEDPKGGYRIELRHSDVSGLVELKAFATAMVCTYLSLLDKLMKGEPIPQPDYPQFLMNRAEILKNGRFAQLSWDGSSLLDLKTYLSKHWLALVEPTLPVLGLKAEDLVAELMRPSRAEWMIETMRSATADHLARHYAGLDDAYLRLETQGLGVR